MGNHRLPQIRNYWRQDCLLGVPSLHCYMSSVRFWLLWSNLHVVDNTSIGVFHARSSLCWMF